MSNSEAYQMNYKLELIQDMNEFHGFGVAVI